jgi:urease gamma subunit
MKHTQLGYRLNRNVARITAELLRIVATSNDNEQMFRRIVSLFSRQDVPDAINTLERMQDAETAIQIETHWTDDTKTIVYHF